jgi:hypothetical protein
MATVNCKRVWLGGIVGGLAWWVWSVITNFAVLMPRYTDAGVAGTMLVKPRYPFFLPAWFGILLVLALACAWLLAGVRATRGATLATAIAVGAVLGFAAGFPINFSLAAWSPMPRMIPLWWMLELWVGAIIATVVAHALYRD